MDPDKTTDADGKRFRPGARLVSIGQLRRIDQGNRAEIRQPAQPRSFRSIDDRQGSAGRPRMYIR
jgi:hypothetical protein